MSETTKNLGAGVSIEAIKAGSKAFATEGFEPYASRFEALSSGQWPETLFIACSDSRVVPNLQAQAGPGDLFIMRNAGNIIPAKSEDTVGYAATVEYAVSALKVKNIVVCGHRCCGAMGALLANKGERGLSMIDAWLEHSEGILDEVKALPAEQQHDRAIELNTFQQLDNLMTYEFVANAVQAGELKLHAWVHDFRNGETVAGDPETKQFTAL